MAPLSRRSRDLQHPHRRLRPDLGKSMVPQVDTSNTLSLMYRPRDEDLHPLQAMAERVGKEVEKFAENVDTWVRTIADDNATPSTNHRATMDLVYQLKAEAEANLRILNKRLAQEARGAPNKRLERVREEEIIQSVEEDIGVGSGDTRALLKQTKSEVATWELLRIMVEHNYQEPGTDVSRIKQELLARTRIDKYAEPGQVWDRFLIEHDTAREKDLILRWLEVTADEVNEDVSVLVDRKFGRGAATWSKGWFDTKSKLKQERRMHPLDRNATSKLKRNDTGEPLVSQLDPDAPSRQVRALDKADEDYEKAIWMCLWEMIRRGASWQTILDWCSERNEYWRAVGLGKSFPNEGLDGNDRRNSVRSRHCGELWRHTNYSASQNAQNEYEAAVYGLLAGDIAHVDPVCKTWDDLLYVRLNNVLVSSFNHWQHQNFPSLSLKPNACLRPPPSIWNPEDSATNENDFIIAHLLRHQTAMVEGAEPMKLIQGALICKTFDRIAGQLGAALCQIANQNGVSFLLPQIDSPVEEPFVRLAHDYDALRVATHILLIFRGLGMSWHSSTRIHLYESVLVGYVEFLRMAGKIDLVPLYASLLSPDIALKTLASALTDIRNHQEREIQVRLMEHYGINVDEVLERQLMLTYLNAESKHPNIERYAFLEPVKHNQWPGYRISLGFLQETVPREDEHLMRSCEWYMNLPGRWEDTFDALTGAAKLFLRQGKLGSAVKLIDRLNCAQVSKLKTRDMEHIKRGIDVMDDNESFAQGQVMYVSELRALKLYRQQLQFSCKVYYQCQQLVHAIRMLDEWRVEEDQLIKLKSSGAPMPPKNRIRDLLERVVDAVQPLLDNFLTCARADMERETLHLIARAYLPEVILAYNSVLHSAAHMVGRDYITRCMDLATAIAAPGNEYLSRTFVETGRMRELVEAFAQSSLAMIRLTEQSGKETSKKRSREGQTMRLWEINTKISRE